MKMISVKLIMILADNDAANGSVDGEFFFGDEFMTLLLKKLLY